MASSRSSNAPTSENSPHISGNAAKNTALIVTLMACNYVAGFTETMMNSALVKLSDALGVELTAANWTVVGFTIMAAVTITTSEFLLKRLGLKRVMLLAMTAQVVGCVLGIVASLACRELWLFVLGRLFQAVTTGLCFPVVTSALLQLAPAGKAGTLISTNSAAIAVGTSTAPLISGFMLDTFGLAALYAVPLVLALALLLAAARFVHNLFPRENRAGDYGSLVLSAVALTLFIYGLSLITKDLTLGALFTVAGVAVAAAFVLYERARKRRGKTVLLDLDALKLPSFSLAVVQVMCVMVCEAALLVLLPLYFEKAGDTSSFEAGALLVGPALVYAAMSFVSGKLYDVHGFWPLVTAGCAFGAIGLALVALVAPTRSPQLVALIAVVAFAGIGLAYPAIKVTELKPLAPSQDAAGSAINSTSIQVANSCGQALFVGVFSSVAAARMAAHNAEAAAWAEGFQVALIIACCLVAAAALISFIYARKLYKKGA
jgi:DHA2 family lincomycin resistance protein-like MFS transporter